VARAIHINRLMNLRGRGGARLARLGWLCDNIQPGAVNEIRKSERIMTREGS